MQAFYVTDQRKRFMQIQTCVLAERGCMLLFAEPILSDLNSKAARLKLKNNDLKDAKSSTADSSPQAAPFTLEEFD